MVDLFPSPGELLVLFLWQVAAPVAGLALLLWSVVLFARNRSKHRYDAEPFTLRRTTALFLVVSGSVLFLAPFAVNFFAWTEERERRAMVEEAQSRVRAARQAYGSDDALAAYPHDLIYFFADGSLPKGFEQAGAYEDGGTLSVGYVDPERKLDAGQLGIEQSFAGTRDVSNLDTCLMEPGYFESYSDYYDAVCVPVARSVRHTSASAANALPADAHAVLLRLGEDGHDGETLIVYVPNSGENDRGKAMILEVSRPGATPLPDDPDRMFVSLRALSKYRAERRLCGYSYNNCYRTP